MKGKEQIKFLGRGLLQLAKEEVNQRLPSSHEIKGKIASALFPEIEADFKKLQDRMEEAEGSLYGLGWRPAITGKWKPPLGESPFIRDSRILNEVARGLYSLHSVPRAPGSSLSDIDHNPKWLSPMYKALGDWAKDVEYGRADLPSKDWGIDNANRSRD